MRPARFAPAQQPATAAAVEPVRITQFYPAVAQLGSGEKTTLCYGVEGAKSLRLSPPVEPVWPALTRCFEVAPPHTTRYTLTAEDARGQSVSEATTIEVGPARPAIIEVSVNKLTIAAGEQVVLCFKAKNASNYEVPGVRPIALNTPARGCFEDHPRVTKTYMVKVTGPGGADSERVTVRVK